MHTVTSQLKPRSVNYNINTHVMVFLIIFLGSTLGKYFKEALTRIKDPNSNLNIHLVRQKNGVNQSKLQLDLTGTRVQDLFTY